MRKQIIISTLSLSLIGNIATAIADPEKGSSGFPVPAGATSGGSTAAFPVPAGSNEAPPVVEPPAEVTPPKETPKAVAPVVTAPKDFSPQNDENAQKFRAELHAKKGKDMMRDNNFRQAESEYKEAARIEPGNLGYIEGYAAAAHKASDWREVAESYTQLLKADASHHNDAYAVIGEANYKLHKFDEAVDAYKKAAQFEKDKGAIWHKIAEIRLVQGKQSEVMEAYRTAIKVAPSDGKAYKLLAAMEWNANNKAEALRIYKNGAASASKDGDLLAAYAYALMSEQQYQEAANMYKAAAAVKGTTPEIDAGYKSALEHIAFDQKQAELKAAHEKKKPHH